MTGNVADADELAQEASAWRSRKALAHAVLRSARRRSPVGDATKRLAGAGVTAEVISLNGEAVIVVRLEGRAFSIIHAETRNALIATLRVVRDPERLARLR